PFTLTATAGQASAQVTINVVPSGPHFDSLIFTPSGNAGGTITATAHDLSGTTMNHAWTASDPSVTFTPATGTGSPVTSAVTFGTAGQFTLTDKITDNSSPAPVSASSSTVVTVSQALKTIMICPAGVTMNCPTSL